MTIQRLATFCLIGVALIGLSACGFSPMYGRGGPALDMQNIQVETGQDRVDFLLQEALNDRLGSRHNDGSYILLTESDVSTMGLGVGADAIAARFAVRLDVEYRLMRAGEDEPVIEGDVTSEASYDVSSSVYGSLSSERDAELRAAQLAADRITLQIARALRNRDGS